MRLQPSITAPSRSAGNSASELAISALIEWTTVGVVVGRIYWPQKALRIRRHISRDLDVRATLPGKVVLTTAIRSSVGLFSWQLPTPLAAFLL